MSGIKWERMCDGRKPIHEHKHVCLCTKFHGLRYNFTNKSLADSEHFDTKAEIIVVVVQFIRFQLQSQRTHIRSFLSKEFVCNFITLQSD